MDIMDALTERVLLERIRILSERLDAAIEQRDGFARCFHDVTRVPHQERHEIIRDCDREIERIGNPASEDN